MPAELFNPAKPATAAAELVGVLDRVRYRDPDTGFCVLELRSGAKVKLEDPDKELVEGRPYRFLGRYADHARYGRSFQADVWAQDLPATERATLEYLADFAPGVGTRRAKALWDAFGADAVRALRDETPRAATACGLTEEDAKLAADALQRLAASEGAKIELYRLFAGRGFPKKLTREALAHWAKRGVPLSKIPTLVQRNPFALLLAGLPGCGFKRTDRLYLELGHPREALKRQAACAWHAVRAGSNGSTWVLREAAEDAVAKDVGAFESRPGRAIALAVRCGLLAEREAAAGTAGKYLAEARAARNERVLAGRVRALSAGPARWPALPALCGASPHQLGEWARATAGPVGLLLGTPGTGKTWLTGQAVRAVVDRYGRPAVALCAPTGKAAVRLTAAVRAAGVPMKATTIHSLLGYGPGGWPGTVLAERFVLVDEISMGDTDLVCALLESCGPGTHVLFVGDPYQLPPVGHGAPLRDLQAAGLPCGLLAEVRRNGGLITAGCAAIKDGLPPRTCKAVDLDAGDNLRLLEAGDPAAAKEALAAVLERLKAKHAADRTQVDPVWDCQVIVAANTKGELARKPVNDLLQGLLNPEGDRGPGVAFRREDKVICLKNGWYSAVEPVPGLIGLTVDAYRARQDPHTGKAESYVANGELGRVEAVGEKVFVARFTDPERWVRVGVGAAAGDDEDDADRGRGCNFDLGYAITCHRSQGSQWPYVVVALDDQAALIGSREWLYVAVSRAEKLCILIGKQDTAERFIRRRVLHTRRTFLKELLTEPRP